MVEQTTNVERSRQERWANETSHFNAVEYATAPVHPRIVERYARCEQRDYHQSEYFFSLLSDVKGKHVLDLGCGDGGNAILLALRGAFVTGIDISDKAIEAAKVRAARHGLSRQTDFICSPLELLRSARPFDIVVGQAILHHVLSELDATFKAIRTLSAPHAYCIFLEPVNLSPTLRRLRLMVPVPTCGTADERPLERADLDVIQRYLPDLEMRLFGILARLGRFFLHQPYEFAPRVVRLAYDAAVRMDYVAVRHLGLQKLAACAVLSGHLAP
jgi:2-polyprenyl-3-methyl-5-hydroxy-6-metoxy-1,4-benzoquinol methylase